MLKKALCFLLLAVLVLCAGCNIGGNNAVREKTYSFEIVAQTDLKIDNQFTRPFQNGYAIIFILDDNYESGSYAFIDKNGEILADRRYNLAFPFENDGRALVQLSDRTWEYIDKNGVKVADGEERPKSGLPVYNDNGLYGLTDNEGNRVTEPIYSFVNGFNSGLSYVRTADGDKSSLLVDRAGLTKVTLPADWTNATYAGEDIMIHEGGLGYGTQYQYFTLSGEPLSDMLFDMAGNFENGVAPVAVGNKLGLIDSEGKLVIEPSLLIEPFYLDGLSIGDGLIVCASSKSNLMIVRVVEQ